MMILESDLHKDPEASYSISAPLILQHDNIPKQTARITKRYPQQQDEQIVLHQMVLAHRGLISHRVVTLGLHVDTGASETALIYSGSVFNH